MILENIHLEIVKSQLARNTRSAVKADAVSRNASDNLGTRDSAIFTIHDSRLLIINISRFTIDDRKLLYREALKKFLLVVALWRKVQIWLSGNLAVFGVRQACDSQSSHIRDLQSTTNCQSQMGNKHETCVQRLHRTPAHTTTFRFGSFVIRDY